jgi:hypothetical protein
MKNLFVLAAVLLSLACGTARAAGTAHDESSLHVPARDGAQVLAQDADIVCKLGCWG